MNENKKKGMMLIIGGVLVYIILHFGFKELHLREFEFLSYIIGIGLVIFGVVTLVKNPIDDNMSLTNTETSNSGDCTHNKIVNVTLWGGLMGLFAGSPKQKLTKAIEKENLNGYRVVQIIDAASGNVLLWLLRLIILCLTIFIFTTANGYYIIFEKNDKNSNF